jgi:hypothetical protein
MVIASVADAIPEGNQKQVAQSVALGMAHFISVELPKAVKENPALGAGRISGMFILSPATAIKLGRANLARFKSAYVPERAMAIEFSVVSIGKKRTSWESLSQLDQRKMGEAINEQLLSGAKEAVALSPDGGFKITVRNVPYQQIVGQSLFHFTPDVTNFVPFGKQGPVKLEGALYTSPEAAMRFGVSSAGGQPMVKPGIIEIRVPEAWRPEIAKTYQGKVELESTPSDVYLDPIPGFTGKGVSANAWMGSYPIYRYTIRGLETSVKQLGAKELSALRLWALRESLGDFLQSFRPGSRAGAFREATKLRPEEFKGRYDLAADIGLRDDFMIAQWLDVLFPRSRASKQEGISKADADAMLAIGERLRADPRSARVFDRFFAERYADVLGRGVRDLQQGRAVREVVSERSKVDRSRDFERVREYLAEVRRENSGGRIEGRVESERATREGLRVGERAVEDRVAEMGRLTEGAQQRETLREETGARVAPRAQRTTREETIRTEREASGVKGERGRAGRGRRYGPRLDKGQPRPPLEPDIIGKKARLPDGSLAWRQGWTWKWVPKEDWLAGRGRKPRSLGKGITPVGARFTDLRSARDTVQMIGDPGAAVPDVSVDLGVADIHITDQAQSIQYVGKGEATNVGERIESTTQGMTVGAAGGKGHAYAGDVYPAHSVSRTAIAAGEAETSVRGVNRPKIAKETQEIVTEDFKGIEGLTDADVAALLGVERRPRKASSRVKVSRKQPKRSRRVEPTAVRGITSPQRRVR